MWRLDREVGEAALSGPCRAVGAFRRVQPAFGENFSLMSGPSRTVGGAFASSLDVFTVRFRGFLVFTVNSRDCSMPHRLRKLLYQRGFKLKAFG